MEVSIDGTTFVLEHGQNIEDVKRRIEEAGNSPPRFVEFVVRGGLRMSVRITSQTRVTVCVRPAAGAGDEPLIPPLSEWDL
ncbi:hypothetical protein L2X99_11890 [Microbacterium sp. KUDC0406]|uniref:hypothetical protein n=1 Tax=Microbacterium sp. KUDC0406 TaxID=2909588 RepID=UPI001F1E5F90|nr:hypothetical protein [Microbacterium sp. KUDC0406]UJP09145.1 hypothetical protein L2X99_11890 [Microbacterium sp. KUDC0406]